ncbi:MAG TPA: glycosyltransferase family 2 protein [Nevskiaceae bacterium]|nr:glycosyltransferase family 2 protein [Nevskiaceae bacterium]
MNHIHQPSPPIEPVVPRRPAKSMLALLVAAHNEEMVIEQTLRSAIRAGMRTEDIYVVDDNSGDNTSALARGILGPNNVIKVRRSGKGLALTKAARKFRLTKRYRWIHIADADGGFAPDYFNVFRRELRVSYAAATGYVRSLPGSNISEYRVFEYTIGMELHRRFQAAVHVVSVIPGPSSCFRADVFEQLDFANRSLTEDLDVTLQLHRKRLGKVQFIPKAVAYTQDPQNIQDFIKQITRWNRGIVQAIKRHKIGLHRQRIDVYLSYQVLQNMLFAANYLLVVPYLAWRRESWGIVSAAFVFDIALTFGLTFIVAVRAHRKDILSAFPVIYILRWVTMIVFLRACVEVFILGRFKVSDGVWNTAGRRYKADVNLS